MGKDRHRKWRTLQDQWVKRGGSPFLHKRCFIDYKAHEVWYYEDRLVEFLDRVLGKLYVTPLEEAMKIIESYENLIEEALYDRELLKCRPDITSDSW